MMIKVGLTMKELEMVRDALATAYNISPHVSFATAIDEVQRVISRSEPYPFEQDPSNYQFDTEDDGYCD